MTSEQRKRSIRAALAVGALGIAAALSAIDRGDPPDCSPRAQCQRLDEQMGAWIRCPDKECVTAVETAVSEIQGHCPITISKCTREMMK